MFIAFGPTRCGQTIIHETYQTHDRGSSGKWFRENDPEGVAFEYEMLEPAEKPDEFLESPVG
jgi:hypothetical protein